MDYEAALETISGEGFFPNRKVIGGIDLVGRVGDLQERDLVRRQLAAGEGQRVGRILVAAELRGVPRALLDGTEVEQTRNVEVIESPHATFTITPPLRRLRR